MYEVFIVFYKQEKYQGRHLSAIKIPDFFNKILCSYVNV